MSEMVLHHWEDLGSLPKAVYAVKMVTRNGRSRKTLVRIFVDKDTFEAFVKRMTDYGMVGDAEVTTHCAELTGGTKKDNTFWTQWQETGVVQEKPRVVALPAPPKKKGRVA